MNIMHDREKCMVMFEGYDTHEMVNFGDIEPFEVRRAHLFMLDSRDSFRKGITKRRSKNRSHHQHQHERIQRHLSISSATNLLAPNINRTTGTNSNETIRVNKLDRIPLEVIHSSSSSIPIDTTITIITTSSCDVYGILYVFYFVSHERSSAMTSLCL